MRTRPLPSKSSTIDGWPYEPRDESEQDPQRDSSFVCALTDTERRARAGNLRSDFLPRIVDLEEIEDGCIFWFQRTEENLVVVSDFVLVESKCCDFLDFGIGLGAGGERISLRISGPRGPANFLTRAREALAMEETPSTTPAPTQCECC